MDKFYKTIRITCLLLAGLAIYIMGAKIFTLWKDMYVAREDKSLLDKDFAVATTYGYLTKSKLKSLSSKYSSLLQENKEQISAYAQLEARYSYLKTWSKEVYSKLQGKETIEKKCKDNICLVTKDDCYIIFDGESFNTNFKDYHIAISVSARRLTRNKWNTDVTYKLDQKFRLELIETTSIETGYTRLHANLAELDGSSDGKPLDIEEFKIAKAEDIESGFNIWSPSLELGVYQPIIYDGQHYPSPFIGLSLSNYRNPKTDIFHFFRLGVGVSDQTAFFLFTPASYNIGSQIPLISDLWLGLDIGLDMTTKYSLGFSLSTNL